MTVPSAADRLAVWDSSLRWFQNRLLVLDRHDPRRLG